MQLIDHFVPRQKSESCISNADTIFKLTSRFADGRETTAFFLCYLMKQWWVHVLERKKKKRNITASANGFHNVTFLCSLRGGVNPRSVLKWKLTELSRAFPHFYKETRGFDVPRWIVPQQQHLHRRNNISALQVQAMRRYDNCVWCNIWLC